MGQEKGTGVSIIKLFYRHMEKYNKTAIMYNYYILYTNNFFFKDPGSGSAYVRVAARVRLRQK